MAQRRGFTLAEILVALTLMLIVSGAVYKLLVTTQRVSRDQAQRVNLQSNVRVSTLAVLNDLREIGTFTGGTGDRNDILSIAPSAISYRAMRGAGFICAAPTATQIRISRSSFSGYRDPQPGRDAFYVFLDGDPNTETDDTWLPVAIAAVSSATACPGTLGDGITLTTADTPALASLAVGTPLRFYEVMELTLLQVDGKSWLGARSISAGEAVQPVLGPLAEENGLQFEYLNAAGATTADLTAIKSIRVTIRALSEGQVHAGLDGGLTQVQEELVTQVALRNAFRP
jgi:prepilin-type N-terminal cleavage/methylation domain-containing protein